MAIEPDESIYQSFTNEDIPNLKRLAHDKESWMVSRALYALARLKSKEAYEIIRHAAKDPRSEIRVAVSVASTLLPPEIAEEIVFKLLGDPDVSVKKFAIKAVSKKSGPSTLNKLTEMSLGEKDSFIRSLSKEALQKIK